MPGVDLDPQVKAIGRLVGLLTDSDAVNTDWFAAPWAELAGIPKRVEEVLDVLDAVFGPATADGPPVFPEAQWYPIRNPLRNNVPTSFCVVAPKPTAGIASGVVGAGVLAPFGYQDLTLTAYGFLPLFELSTTAEPEFVVGTHATQVGLRVTSSSTFSANGGVTFRAIALDAQIVLSSPPVARSLELTFEDLQINGVAAPPSASTYDSFEKVVKNISAIVEWVAAVILNGTYWLNTYVGHSASTVGELLTSAGILRIVTSGDEPDATQSYELASEYLSGNPPERIAEDFIFALMSSLSESEDPLVPVPGGGIFVARRASSGNIDDYGLRIAADLALSSKPAGTGSASPEVDLCLGTWFSGETSTSNWITEITRSSGVPLAPGLSVFLLRRDVSRNAPVLTFVPSFELTSVGIDIRGGGDAPLVNVDGYTLRGTELRANLSSTDWSYGFAARLDKVGFPLGTKFDGGSQPSGSNGVAQNLLASSAQTGAPGETSAVNPGFSAEAGYIKGFAPRLTIYDPQGAATDLIWFPVQERFGPINCRQIGLKIETSGEHESDPVLGMVFDGGVALGALDVELDQLSVDVELKKVADVSAYSLDLQGLAVSFNTNAVELSGGLYKTEHRYQGNPYIAYDGEAVLKFKDWALSALGTYASLPGGTGTSLFIFATLNAPLGGPPFFYVTGLAAGFGYNRALKIPSQDEVQSFPLLAGLADTSLLGGKNPRPQDVLAKLEDWVPPVRGEYWLAAGVQFTTFEIIKSNVLLIVEFGRDFIVSILGISTLKQPATGTTYAYAELDLEVVFDPAKGVIRASGVLAPSSYVLTPEAHLTGGFGFCSWFGDQPRAGDFVFTVGGYHPAFVPRDGYPDMPRVGINWQVDQSIAITGGAYFAITPTAMMVGGGFSVTYDGGRLKAWLKAQADAIVLWKPFYLIAEASINVGVSYRLEFLSVDTTLSVEIGADFRVWGPPTGGSIHVDWYIISFTIPFGKDQAPRESLTWDEFKGLLPAKPPVKNGNAALHARLAALPGGAKKNGDSSTPAYLSIKGAGLASTITVDDAPVWLVRAGRFTFHAVSAIPASSIDFQGRATSIEGQPVAIRSVNGGISQQDYRSSQTVTILKAGQAFDLNGWNIDAIVEPLPQAMWGDPLPPHKDPDINPDTPTVDGTVGVTMYPKAPDPTPTPVMVIESVFVPITIPGPGFVLPISPARQPAGHPPQEARSFDDIAHVDSPTVVDNRAALFGALVQLGINGWTNDALPKMAADPGDDFPDEPLEVFPGATVTT